MKLIIQLLSMSWWVIDFLQSVKNNKAHETKILNHMDYID